LKEQVVVGEKFSERIANLLIEFPARDDFDVAHF